MEVEEIPGNGYCFLNSVVTCLQNDYGDSITIDDLIAKIVSRICTNYRQYTQFHTFADSSLPPPDTLIEDALQFFKYGNYLQDIVDLLMQITADALRLNLFIYQKSGILTQVLHFQHPMADRIVRVRFTHNNLHSEGNHYDSIICKRPNPPRQPDVECVHEEETLSKSPQSTSHTTISSFGKQAEQFVDLTVDDSLSDDNAQSDTTYFSPPASVHSSNGAEHDVFLRPPRQTFGSSASDTTRSTLTSSNEDLSIQSHPMESEMEALLRNICRGKPFPTWYFREMEPEYVPKIPPDIDGIGYYKIRVNKLSWQKVTSDLRHFLMMTSSRDGFTGERRIGTCMGSYICRYPECPFVQTSRNRAPNKVSWRIPRGRRGVRICAICDHIGEREGCGAKKLVEYDPLKQEATVYHIGKHSCWPKPDNKKRYNALRKKISEKNLRGPAKQVGLEQISKYIEDGDMDGAAEECETWVDRRAAERHLQYNKPTYGNDHNSFDAVGLVKRKTDKRDPYYIFEIGNKNYTTDDECDYVFKSSRRMAQLAIDMDQDGEENLLQMENAYFDATHSRVHGFKTFGLWLVHPAMLQILRLASMEIRSENYIEISRFFILFNRMLSQVKGQVDYKFNPRYFVCDEGGANWKALRHIYGEKFTESRARGCQWHFKSDVRNNINKVGAERRDDFAKYCCDLCEATTVAQYDEAFYELQRIGDEYPEIKPFLKYWDLRKSHVFGPFRGCGIPGVNLSEAANKSFKPPQRLSLVEAAKYDVATMMWQETQLDLFRRNLLKCAGRAPTKEVKDSKERSRQMKVATDFVNILDDHSAVMLEAQEGMDPARYVQKKGTHRAPVKTAKKDSKTRKAKVRKEQGKEKEIDEKELQAKCIAAMEIMDCDLLPESGISIVKNPPSVYKADWNIRKCKGCKKEITAKDKEYPHNMVFRRIGLRGYMNRILNKWIEAEEPVHFHLNMACLRKHDPTMEKRYITTNDEFFIEMDNEQMGVLHNLGFLKPIARKKTA